MDREDIQLLVKTMDDVIDLVTGAAQRLHSFEITEVPPGLTGMARVLLQAMEEVKKALDILQHMKNPDDTLRHCIEINRLENECDTLVQEYIGRLFREHRDDPLLVIKLKEIYEAVENAVDRCEDIANVIETITIKQS